MSKLDRLCHLEKDIAMAAMQCDVVLAEEEFSSCPPLALPLNLGFFNYEAKVKLQAHLAVTLPPVDQKHVEYCVELQSCNLEYGRSGIQSAITQLLADHKTSGLSAIVNGICSLLK